MSTDATPPTQNLPLYNPAMTVAIAVGVFVVAPILSVVLLALLGHMPGQFDGSDPNDLILSDPGAAIYFLNAELVASALALGILLGFIDRRAPDGILAGLNIRPFSLVEAGRWLALFAGLVVGMEIVIPALHDATGVEPTTDALDIAVGSDLRYIFLVLLLAPVLEEVLFRGFLFEGLSVTFLGPLGAAVLSTGLWVLIHTQYDPVTLVYVLGLGALLTMARLKTGNLAIPIMLHVFNNGIALLFMV